MEFLHVARAELLEDVFQGDEVLNEGFRGVEPVAALELEFRLSVGEAGHAAHLLLEPVAVAVAGNHIDGQFGAERVLRRLRLVVVEAVARKQVDDVLGPVVLAAFDAHGDAVLLDEVEDVLMVGDVVVCQQEISLVGDLVFVEGVEQGFGVSKISTMPSCLEVSWAMRARKSDGSSASCFLRSSRRLLSKISEFGAM